jgi:hypothetical protein
MEYRFHSSIDSTIYSNFEKDSINYDEDTTILDLNDTNIFELLTRYLSVNNAQSINFGQSQYLANHDNLSLDANTNRCS